MRATGKGGLSRVDDPRTSLPLVVPVDTTMEQFRRMVEPGRYRLDALTADGQTVEEMSAYVNVLPLTSGPTAYPYDEEPDGTEWDDEQDESRPVRRHDARNDNNDREAMRSTVRLAESVVRAHTPIAAPGLANAAPAANLGTNELLAEVVRQNSRMAELVIKSAAEMMTAASQVLAAADGAKLPQRQAVILPAAVPVANDTDDAEAEPQPGGLLNMHLPPMVSDLINLALDRFMQKGGGGIPFGAMFDWRKAAPGNPAAPAADSVPPSGSSTASSAAPVPPPGSPTVSSAAPPPRSAAPVPPPTAPTASSAAPPPRSAAPMPSSATPMPSAASTPPAAPMPSSAAPVPNAVVSTSDASAAAPAGSPAADPAEIERAAVNERMIHIWTALTDPERTLAEALINKLTPIERMVWIAELMQLSLADAIARVRSVLQPRAPATPPTPSVPS